MKSRKGRSKRNQIFISNSKVLFYILVAFILGFFQILEDVVDGELSWSKSVLKFVVISIVMSYVLYGLGRLARYIWFKLDIIQDIVLLKSQILLKIVLCVILVPIFVIGIVYLTPLSQNSNHVWTAGILSFMFTLIVVVYEFFWLILEHRQDLEVRNQKLTTNVHEAKYQALINQINPHFLFNSMNVLMTLVRKDASVAEEFILKLSEVYRYILQLNDVSLISLEDELEFINSYMYLQQIRHRDNLHYNVNVDSDSAKKRIPPLTLQMLIENAIKHNIINKDHPLNINLYIEDDVLVVTNNLQKRMDGKAASTHVGLKNIAEKYELLHSKLPEFKEEDDLYVAKIPLINN